MIVEIDNQSVGNVMKAFERVARFVMAVGMLAGVLMSGLAEAYEAFQGPTELIYHDAQRAYRGYTMFTPSRGRNTYLIDMNGEVIHTWPIPASWRDPEIRENARLLDDGMLARSETVADGSTPGTYQLVDWDGAVVWEYESAREDLSGHHDFRFIHNPKLGQRTLIYSATRETPHEKILALGADPALRESYDTRPDGLVEVDMDGNIVWEWNISDHVVQDFDPNLPGYGVVSEHPGRLDINFGPGVSGNWIHMNGWDFNEVLDHVAINNSRMSEFYVVDHGATFVPGDPQRSRELAASDAGDFIYRWGNPCVSDTGECPSMTAEGLSTSNGHQQLFFSHDIQWIDGGDFGALDGPVPGAGHFLIFNNGARQPGPTFSSVIEIDPYDGPMESGIYIPAAVAGYDPMPVGGGMSRRTQNVSRQVVWSFHGISPNSFYSPYISGAQRLPNGNTLVCSGAHGHIFEVTPEGAVVWEFINPVGVRLVNARGIYRTMADKAGDEFNSIFKCQRYAPDYPGLNGKDLTPRGTITEYFSEAVELKP
ncbi:MAG: hypothetical protein F4181_10200 [Proteobacteria bacterium]|nr:hypothetical protein [Pseudomonadota bacterium]